MQVVPLHFEGVDVLKARIGKSSLQVFGDPKSELIQNYVVSCFLLSDDQFATKEDRKSCKQRATVVKELLLMWLCDMHKVRMCHCAPCAEIFLN